MASPHFALVLGNNAYQSLPPLPACQASASTVSAALRRSGWTVRDVRDPSNGQMGAAIGAFGDAMAKAPGAVALIYSCGYATTFENRLSAVDGRPGQPPARHADRHHQRRLPHLPLDAGGGPGR